MPTSIITKRALCARCQRAQRTCICQWTRSITPKLQVLVLQHPLEVQQAKGSGRLLHLSLEHSRMVVGEQFEQDVLEQLLFGVWNVGEGAIQTLLLYPETPAATAVSLATELAQLRRLVVLDATWRKSRKMLHLNPVLQQLPRLSLQDPPASHYRIRKAHRPEQLSTLEATCYALAQLEQDQSKYLPLLQGFDGFVAQQAGYAASAL